jgi:hypothetical protein
MLKLPQMLAQLLQLFVTLQAIQHTLVLIILTYVTRLLKHRVEQNRNLDNEQQMHLHR